MNKKIMLPSLMVMLSYYAAFAGPPLPRHNIEGNSGVFITSTAYLYNPPADGKGLGLPSFSIKAENDWWTVCLAYVINDHMSIAGGYGNFGNILNHRENNVGAIQLKNEF